MYASFILTLTVFAITILLLKDALFNRGPLHILLVFVLFACTFYIATTELESVVNKAIVEAELKSKCDQIRDTLQRRLDETTVDARDTEITNTTVKLPYVLHWHYVAKSPEGVWYAYRVEDTGKPLTVGVYTYENTVKLIDQHSSVVGVELNFENCHLPVDNLLYNLIRSIPRLEANCGEWNDQYWYLYRDFDNAITLKKVYLNYDL